MTTTKLDELEQLEKAATKGPWAFDEMRVYVWGPRREMVADTLTDGEEASPDREVAVRVRGHGARLPQDANGALVAASRNALPSLLKIARLALVRLAAGHAPECTRTACVCGHEELRAALEEFKP